MAQNLQEYLRNLMICDDDSIAHISRSTGIHVTTLYGFVQGRRNVRSTILQTLLDYYNVTFTCPRDKELGHVPPKEPTL